MTGNLLDYICFKDIWGDDDIEEHEILGRVEFDKEDIGESLTTLKFDILGTFHYL
jgi:hypothetical protein